MNAVIYARFSSANQNETSITAQIRECKAFAERKGYTVIKTYADRAISGKRADNRPEFQQMISDSANGSFDYIIVWKLDRFSRNKYDSVIYKAKLGKNDVSVISATEPIDDSPEGVLMEAIFEGFSEYYVKELSVKTVRGMSENLIQNKSNGGSPTWGYIIDENKHFTIDPINAPIVKEIFENYSEGKTIREILDMLNAKNVTNNGKKHTYHSINHMLKNTRYIGEYKFQDMINTEAIPPIIDKELFDRCQQRINANKHKPASFRKVDEKFLLTGKVFCGCCGASMSGVSATGRSNTYRYYQCVKSKKKLCAKKKISKDLLEKAVLMLTMEVLGNRTLVKRICNACFSLQNTNNSNLPLLQKKLKQNEKEIENIMTAVKAGIITRSTKSELERLEDEKEAIEIEIAKEQIIRSEIPREHIEEWILSFAKTNLNSQEQKQRLIDIFVNSVHVFDDKIVIFFNYKNGEKCISIDDVKELINNKKTNTLKKCSSFVVCGVGDGNRTHDLRDHNPTL